MNGPANQLHGCGSCHRLLTSARQPMLAEYRAAGLLLIEGQDPTAVPVRSPAWPRPVLLDQDGGWRPA